MRHCEFWGFKGEPFADDLPAAKLLRLPEMVGVKERIDYCLGIGGLMVVTGEVGSGKSSALRWSLSHYHPSEVQIVDVVGHAGSVIDFYRALCLAMGDEDRSHSRTMLLKTFRGAIESIALGKKQKILIVIDEASLLRDEVFSELHTIMQFACDSKRLFAMVFAGQVDLLDKLANRRAAPLASRVIAKAHMKAIDRTTMAEYLAHHIKLVGGKRPVFAETAITAIHQGSGGFLRKANSLAKGALIAASLDKAETVDPEHVRIAASELLS